jgi:hypothetical protein
MRCKTSSVFCNAAQMPASVAGVLPGNTGPERSRLQNRMKAVGNGDAVLHNNGLVLVKE